MHILSFDCAICKKLYGKPKQRFGLKKGAELTEHGLVEITLGITQLLQLLATLLLALMLHGHHYQLTYFLLLIHIVKQLILTLVKDHSHTHLLQAL